MFGQTFGGSGFGQNNAFQSNNSNVSGNLFGSNTGMNQAQQQPTAFGSTAPTQSTGLFGQASQPATSGFGGFGQPQQQTNNSFGQPQQGSSLFGAKPSPFGGSTTTGGLSATPAFGAASGTNMAGSGQGTAAVAFQARQEPEPSKPTSTNIYQSITAMPQYSNFSFEELRWQDYQQNRRYGDGNVGGTANAFGGTPSTPFSAGNTSTGFGFGTQNQNQTSTFGQPAASNSSPFGQSNTNSGTALFGQSSSSPFGQPKPAFGFGANTQNNSTSGGLFGSNTTNNNNSPFGQNNTNTGTTNSTFGGFGQTNQNANTTGSTFGGFGQNNTSSSGGLFGQNNSNTGGIFGQNNNAANTGGLFGQKPAGTGMFGQANNTTTTNAFGQPSSTGGLFGANTNTNTTNTGGGLFGTNNNANNTNTSGGLFGQKPAGSTLFGQTNNTSTFGQTTGGFGFGQNNANTANTSGGLFGSNNNAAQPSSGGLFGANNSNNSTTTFGQSNGGLFGNTTNNTSNASGGIFGAKPATSTFGQANTTGGGLFGSNTNATTATSGSTIFGGNSTSNTASTGTGLFGQSKPATGGLFGSQTGTNTTNSTGTGLFGQSNTASTGTGLFGNTTNTSTTTPASTFGNTSTTGGGLFGNKPAGTTSLFGSTQPASTATAGATTSLFGKPAGTTSLFGQAANGQATTQQQSTLGGSLFGGSTANIAPAFGTQAAQQPGQVGQSLIATIQQNPYGNNPLFNNVSVPESKTDSFATALTTAPAPRKRLDPLLAFKTRPRRVKQVSGTASPTAGTNTTTSVEAPAEKELMLYNEKTDKLILRSEQFAPRLSALRRLVLDSRGDESELPSVSTIPENAPSDLQAAASSTPPRKSGLESANVSAAANSSVHVATTAADASSLPDNEQVDENGYWISPSQSTLDQMSVKDLESVEHFRIGRKDIGFVTFDAPVDLSGFSNVRKQIGGHLVVFADRMFALYPQDKDCPAPGQGFNVPATVTLYNLWVKAKDTNQPIKDRNNGLCKRQLKRLKQFPGTKFVSWDPETGTWVFNLEPREPIKT